MSFLIYFFGLIVMIAALAIGANHLGVSHFWIGVGVFAILGLGILTGVSQTRHKDPAS